MIPLLDVGASYRSLHVELDEAYKRVMNGGWYIAGSELRSFEEAFASYCGAEFAIGVGNGLDALVLPLLAWGIGPGDDVIVPDFTFIATWLAVSAVGANLVPVGCDQFFGIDVESVSVAITPRTRAVVAVHLYGHPAAMDELRLLCAARDILLLEDAAQAHGASIGSERTGALGDAAGFSFYPGKNLGAFGDGGCVVTNDPSLAEKCLTLRNYGSREKYHHIAIGTNSRLDELQAAFLRVKLRHLDEWNERRRLIALHYTQELADLPLKTPTVRSGSESVWHLYVVQCSERDALRDFLQRYGVETGIHYPIAPARQDCYRHLGLPESAQALSDSVLSLPIGPHLTNEEVQCVVRTVRRFYDAL